MWGERASKMPDSAENGVAIAGDAAMSAGGAPKGCAIVIDPVTRQRTVSSIDREAAVSQGRGP